MVLNPSIAVSWIYRTLLFGRLLPHELLILRGSWVSELEALVERRWCASVRRVLLLQGAKSVMSLDPIHLPIQHHGSLNEVISAMLHLFVDLLQQPVIHLSFELTLVSTLLLNWLSKFNIGSLFGTFRTSQHLRPLNLLRHSLKFRLAPEKRARPSVYDFRPSRPPRLPGQPRWTSTTHIWDRRCSSLSWPLDIIITNSIAILQYILSTGHSLLFDTNEVGWCTSSHLCRLFCLEVLVTSTSQLAQVLHQLRFQLF